MKLPGRESGERRKEGERGIDPKRENITLQENAT